MNFDDTSRERSRIMRSVNTEGTEPEVEARIALEELDVEYEAQPRFGRYRPDFRLEDGTVLQIMGCFWHCCPCMDYPMNEVSSHRDYWSEKHRANRERDRRRRRELLVEYSVPYVFWVWEHQVIAERVAAVCVARGLIDETVYARLL